MNSSSSTPPTITINGDNPAIIQLGDSYADLGATVSDAGVGQAGDTNLGYKTFLNGTLVSNIVLDTSAAATDTIDYVATDSTQGSTQINKNRSHRSNSDLEFPVIARRSVAVFRS